jgi:hypothetical protein
VGIHQQQPGLDRHWARMDADPSLGGEAECGGLFRYARVAKSKSTDRRSGGQFWFALVPIVRSRVRAAIAKRRTCRA